jgi:hypothetical protein
MSEHEIDQLLRSRLEQEASRIDPRPLHARIRNTLRKAAEAQAPRRKLVRRLAWGLAAAAAVALAFVGGLRVGPVQANPETLVREARKAHQLPLERCYLVEAQHEPPLDESNPMLLPPRTIRVWTQGDRFWVEVSKGERRWAWGRDEQGTIWMALGPRHGLRIEADEATEYLTRLCDLFSMRPETLLNDVLRDFELRREEAADAGMQIVSAEPRPERRHAAIRQATLEIDAESKVVRRVRLERAFLGQPMPTVTFTLAESRPPDEALYQLEGHLASPHRVFSRTAEPERRRELLMRWCGPQARRWLRDAPPP